MNLYLVCHSYSDWKNHPNLISVPIRKKDNTKIPNCEALSVGDKIVYFTIGDPNAITYNYEEEKEEQKKYGIRGIYQIKESDCTEFPMDWTENNHRLFKIEPIILSNENVFFDGVLNQGTVRKLSQDQFDKIEKDIIATHNK